MTRAKRITESTSVVYGFGLPFQSQTSVSSQHKEACGHYKQDFHRTAICCGVLPALKCSASSELSTFIKSLMYSETLIMLLMFHLRSGREKNCYFYF